MRRKVKTIEELEKDYSDEIDESYSNNEPRFKLGEFVSCISNKTYIGGPIDTIHYNTKNERYEYKISGVNSHNGFDEDILMDRKQTLEYLKDYSNIISSLQ